MTSARCRCRWPGFPRSRFRVASARGCRWDSNWQARRSARTACLARRTRSSAESASTGAAHGGLRRRRGPPMAEYEPVVGLEIHVQLDTRTKMFCGCELSFGDPPNTHTCPVCLALPGALPVPNEQAIRYALMIAAALGCKVAPRSIFHRKNYFYPDNPKAYQISQYDIPL